MKGRRKPTMKAMREAQRNAAREAQLFGVGEKQRDPITTAYLNWLHRRKNNRFEDRLTRKA